MVCVSWCVSVVNDDEIIIGNSIKAKNLILGIVMRCSYYYFRRLKSLYFKMKFIIAIAILTIAIFI